MKKVADVYLEWTKKNCKEGEVLTVSYSDEIFIISKNPIKEVTNRDYYSI